MKKQAEFYDTKMGQYVFIIFNSFFYGLGLFFVWILAKVAWWKSLPLLGFFALCFFAALCNAFILAKIFERRKTK
jgi:hypothetical protein